MLWQNVAKSISFSCKKLSLFKTNKNRLQPPWREKIGFNQFYLAREMRFRLTFQAGAHTNMDGFWILVAQMMARCDSFPMVPHVLSWGHHGESYGRFSEVGSVSTGQDIEISVLWHQFGDIAVEIRKNTMKSSRLAMRRSKILKMCNNWIRTLSVPSNGRKLQKRHHFVPFRPAGRRYRCVLAKCHKINKFWLQKMITSEY